LKLPLPEIFRQTGARRISGKREVPKDPWKNDYIYICPGSHGDFDLSSLGADGEPGGEGFDKDINNWEIE